MLQAPGRQRAHVRVVRDDDDRLLVCKDFWHTAGWYRRSVGSWLIGRETRALQQLRGLDCVASLVRRPSADCLLTQWVEGTSVATLAAPPADLISQARALVARIHERGVAHGDLGHDSGEDWWGRDCNALVTPGGRLVAYDFAGAVLRRGLHLGFYPVMCDHDSLFVSKLLRRYGPHDSGLPEALGVNGLPPRSRRWLQRLRKL